MTKTRKNTADDMRLSRQLCQGMMVMVMMLFTAYGEGLAQNSYEQLAEKALAQAQADSLTESLATYQEILGTYPSDHRNPLILSNIGQILERIGQDHEALRQYDMALSTLPDNVPILTYRANLLLKMGNWERAHRDYSHILDLDPQHRQALTYRAYIDMRQHHYEEAKQDYTKALSLYPDDETARAGYAVLLQEMGKLSEAIHQLSVLVEQHPERTEYLVMRAEIEVANSQPELALYDLDKAIEKDKSNKDYYLKRGYLLYEGKKYRAAHADFEQAVRLGVPRDTLKSLLKKSK